MDRRDFLKKTVFGAAVVLLSPKTLEGALIDGSREALPKSNPQGDELGRLISYYDGLEIKGSSNISDLLLDNVLYAVNNIISRETDGDALLAARKQAGHEEFRHYFELLCSYFGKEGNRLTFGGNIDIGARIVGKRLAAPAEILMSAAKKSCLLDMPLSEYFFPTRKDFKDWFGSNLPRYNRGDKDIIFPYVMKSIDEMIEGVNKRIHLAKNDSPDKKQITDDVTKYINRICTAVGIATYHPELALSKRMLEDPDYKIRKMEWFSYQGAKIARVHLRPHLKNAETALKSTPLYENLKEEMRS